MTDDQRDRLKVFVERLLFACRKDGITAEKASSDILAIIEAAALDRWDEIETRLAKSEAARWDD